MYVGTEVRLREQDQLEQGKAADRGVAWASVFVLMGFWLPAAIVFSLARS